MFHLFLLSFSHPGFHKCNSDEIFRGTNPEIVHREHKRIIKEDEPKPAKQNIRIKYNLDQVDPSKNYEDEYTCSKSKFGQNISWSIYSNLVCNESKVIKQEQFQLISQAFGEAVEFLQSALKVEHEENTIKPKALDKYGKPYNEELVADADIFLTVCPRIYEDNSNTIASALYTQNSDTTNRPIQGYVFLNVAQGPTEETKEKFKLTFIHEIMHALGISGSAMTNLWNNPITKKPYTKEELFCNMNVSGITRTYLISPNAHEFAVRHYGVEEFTYNEEKCKSGIEIENSGGSGTVGSHPEFRTCYGDLMTGMIVTQTEPVERFTEVSMAMLLDTGFYDVDYTKVKPLVWGHPSTNRNYYLTDFVTGPPQKAFPYDHFFHFKEVQQPSVDYSYYGKTPGFYDLTKAEGPDEYKKAKEWFNPNNNDIIGNALEDFQLFVVPSPDSLFCRDNEVALPNLTRQCACVEYECAEDNSYIILKHGGASFKCTKGGFKMAFGQLKGECPSPRLICPVLKYRSSSFDRDPLRGEFVPPTADAEEESAEGSRLLSGGSGGEGGNSGAGEPLQEIAGAVNGYYLYILFILLAVFAITVIINIISMCCRCCKRNKKKHH